MIAHNSFAKDSPEGGPPTMLGNGPPLQGVHLNCGENGTSSVLNADSKQQGERLSEQKIIIQSL